MPCFSVQYIALYYQFFLSSSSPCYREQYKSVRIGEPSHPGDEGFLFPVSILCILFNFSAAVCHYCWETSYCFLTPPLFLNSD